MGALCSARILSPFLEMVSGRHAHRDLVPSEFWSIHPDDRVPVAAVHSMLENAVERFGDEQLGLRLGRSMCLGQAGPFDYVVRSAATIRDSVEVAGRYSSLLADGYRVTSETWRGYSLIRLFDEISWPRPVADLAMSASYKLHVKEREPFATPVECWFPYPAPADTRAHERSFTGAVLKFDAPFFAIAFNKAYEQMPQPGADPVLQAHLRERCDAILADTTRAFSLRRRVGRFIEEQLRQASGATATTTARALHMSPRTLSRKLQLEGTTFAEELDAVRHELALTYVSESQRPLAEIAYRLGFSHVESFHRAFKRWTGATPLAYRAKFRP